MKDIFHDLGDRLTLNQLIQYADIPRIQKGDGRILYITYKGDPILVVNKSLNVVRDRHDSSHFLCMGGLKAAIDTDKLRKKFRYHPLPLYTKDENSNLDCLGFFKLICSSVDQATVAHFQDTQVEKYLYPLECIHLISKSELITNESLMEKFPRFDFNLDSSTFSLKK